jgi:hypothetical protein
MNICIIGGGNTAHYIAAKVGSGQNRVSIYTTKCEDWSREITAIDNGKVIAAGKLEKCTSDAKEALDGAQLVLITWPTNILAERLHEIEPFLTAGMYVGFIPGFGGKEFIAGYLQKKGCILFGTQRVLSSTKIIKYGSVVECIDNRPNIKLAALRASFTKKCCEIMEGLFHVPCVPLMNYLTVSLTPSNPILHTARVYSLFRNYQIGQAYESPFSLYADWSDEASEILLDMDGELQLFTQSMNPLDLSGVISLVNHYETGTAESKSEQVKKMTAKIRSLKFLKDAAPLKQVQGRYVPDLESRYFREDFPYGLAVIKGFCEIGGIKTPGIDQVLAWYADITGLEYFTKNGFTGKDLKHLPLPQKYGVNSKSDIIDFYSPA